MAAPVPNREIIREYLRHAKRFPHIWCPGCGNGIVLGSLLRAIHRKGWAKDEVVVASGIGCSSRAPVYVDFNTLHTAHGRALPFATGIKLVNPRLHTVVLMGDGDALGIGGNHFIHACRRNIDLTAVVVNNFTYGMTGGQQSPATPQGARATTALSGTIEQPFDIAHLAAAAGATFVARTTTYHVRELEQLLERAFTHKGFSVVEVIAACPTCYGRRNRSGDAVAMMKWQKDVAVPVEKARLLQPEELAGRIVTGVIAEREAPEYVEQYRNLCRAAADEAEEAEADLSGGAAAEQAGNEPQ
ncbi:MAG: 2-oxoacid:ferredoxin oxidoreductase subunit beta [Deltaproteobacteria bacterium]|nr:2-oxoacid:ferredoxin oxidoreductase subunit beta [Deltaproteobacteria bacterium]